MSNLDVAVAKMGSDMMAQATQVKALFKTMDKVDSRTQEIANLLTDVRLEQVKHSSQLNLVRNVFSVIFGATTVSLIALFFKVFS